MPAIVGIISVDFEVSSHDRVENLAWKMAHEGNEGRGYFYRHLEGEATKNRYSCRHFSSKLGWAQNEKNNFRDHPNLNLRKAFYTQIVAQFMKFL